MKKVSISLLFLAALFAAGCDFLPTSEPSEDPQDITKTVVPVSSCAENLTPAQIETADAFVAQANESGIEDLDAMFTNMGNGEWDQAANTAPSQALNLYNKALKEAPGHCGAIFGKAAASLALLVKDPKFNTFAKDVQNFQETELSASASLGDALKMPPEQAPAALLKFSRNLYAVEPPTIKEIQNLVETTLLPKIDTTIAYLEQIMKFDGFSFDIINNGDTVQIDKSEIGPLLAGAKIVKSILIATASFDLDGGMMNDSWDWTETLTNMNEEDFDNLSPVQKAALDHLTGLFETSSSFTRIKADWKTRYQQIPDLLLSAIEDAKAGLSFSKTETAAQQKYDTYIVGTGVNADLDPSDIDKMIDILDLGKKYLEGPVTVKYNKDRSSLKINLRKVFEIDGFQNYLPYYSLLPYPEWNDIVSADTAWWNSFGTGSITWEELMGAAGYSPDDWDLYLEYGYDPQTFEPDFGVLVLSDWSSGIDTVAIYTSSGQPCSYAWKKFYDRVDQGGSFVSEPATGSGTITIGSCRETAGGSLEYVDWIDEIPKGPMVFTNAQGAKTAGLEDLFKSDRPIDMKGKIYFRDPTFAGVFPDLTNGNIWETIDTFDKISPRLMYSCTDWNTGDKLVVNQDQYDDQYSWDWDCSMLKPGAGASDLDWLIYLMEDLGSGTMVDAPMEPTQTP